MALVVSAGGALPTVVLALASHAFAAPLALLLGLEKRAGRGVVVVGVVVVVVLVVMVVSGGCDCDCGWWQCHWRVVQCGWRKMVATTVVLLIAAVASSPRFASLSVGLSKISDIYRSKTIHFFCFSFVMQMDRTIDIYLRLQHPHPSITYLLVASTGIGIVAIPHAQGTQRTLEVGRAGDGVHLARIAGVYVHAAGLALGTGLQRIGPLFPALFLPRF